MDFAVEFDHVDAPVLIAGIDHTVLYVNPAGVAFYTGGAELVGTSLLDCHEEEASRASLAAIVAEMRDGLDERLTAETEDRRVFMVAVRSEDGSLLGYRERYEHLTPSESG